MSFFNLINGGLKFIILRPLILFNIKRINLLKLGFPENFIFKKIFLLLKKISWYLVITTIFLAGFSLCNL